MPKSNENPFETKCRICLTESPVMVPLDSCFKDNSTLLSALVEVMGLKDDIQPLLLICRICKGLLVIAYDLKMQYLESTKTLEKHFGKAIEGNNIPQVLIPSKKADVEIVIGENKYDIKELVIVEKDDKKECNYEGFLRNLGDTVSAKIVSKDYHYKPVEPESEIVVVEKEPTQTIIIEEVMLEDEDDPEINKFIIDHATDSVTKSDEILQNLDIEQLILTPIETIFLDPNDYISSIEDLNVTPVESFKCDYCQKEYKHKGSFLHHLKTCSCLNALHGTTSSTLHICPECRTPCTTKEALIEHIKVTHNSKNLHICKVCDYVAHSDRTLAYHMLKHEDKVFQCEVCGKSFCRKNLLNSHKKIHTQQNSTQVLCPICGKSFHYKSGMVYHMKMHNQTRDYVCNICDKRFYIQATLNRHVRSHTGDRPFPCQYCEKKYYSKSEVLKHEMLHTGVRPFKCEYCDKGFTQKFNLELHMMSHSGTQVCKFCNRTFINSTYLEKHVNSKHKILVQQAQE